MGAAEVVRPEDIELLREAIKLSSTSVQHGNHPFGALLSDPHGQVVLAAENSVVTGGDVTGHAETNLVRLACQTFGRTSLAGYSLYTSCEPCAMCAGAIYWAGIERVVYALAEISLLGLTGSHPDNPTLAVPCRQVFSGGQRPTVVLGPALEHEASLIHRSFWT